MKRVTLLRLMDQISDDAAAYRYLEETRWGGSPVCPHCGNRERIYFLTPANGVSRTTSTGAPTQRRLWKCGECRKKFSVLTGTVMHNSKISVRIWVLCFFEMAASKNGISAREIERKYGVTAKTAWHLLHRIRAAMGNDGPIETMKGTIVADETWIGGRPKNRHQQGRTRPRTGKGHAGTPTHKIPVLTLVNRTTGQARSRVVRDVTGSTLQKVLREHVDVAGSVLHTDGHKGYREIGTEFAAHEWVDHSTYEFVRGDVSTNQCESFFSQLKRSIDGTHHRVSRDHLHRYLSEFDFRFGTRKMTDAERMAQIIEQADGIRLTYEAVKAS